MSTESLRLAGILVVVYPTVVFGGASILWHWITRQTTYYENPLRQRMWRAGHAHAGVLLLVSLVTLLLVDQTDLGEAWKATVRLAVPASAIFVPAAFFLSVLRPDVERPTRLVNVAYLGAASLAIGLVVLGVGLLGATGPAA